MVTPQFRLFHPAAVAYPEPSVYAAPIAHNVWLVPSAGVLSQPTGIDGRARTHADARLDVMMKMPGERTLGVGVGRRGLKITGTW